MDLDLTPEQLRLEREVYAYLDDVITPELEAEFRRPPEGGKLEREYLAKMLLTFGGGANEVLRDVVALAGLGMPRSR